MILSSVVRNTQGLLPPGAYVVSVDAGSPAEAAGVKAGDIIVEVSGEVITDSDDPVASLQKILQKLNAGDQVAVRVFRPKEVTETSISYEGEYLDSYRLGDELIYNGDHVISNVTVDEDNCSATYLITDIYNNEYWTPVIPD